MPPSDVSIGLREIVCHFNELQDPRSTINRLHPLPSVLTIALMGVLAGAKGPTGIAKWAVAKKHLLLQGLDLPNGIPSRDVIRRVLSAVKVDAFQSSFVSWLNSLFEAAKEKSGVSSTEKTHMAIDGKTMKGSHDRANGLGAMHLVRVWLSDFGLTLAQVATEEKSNEITAIPEVLRLVDLKGAIITIDAMGTQTAIADQIVNVPLEEPQDDWRRGLYERREGRTEDRHSLFHQQPASRHSAVFQGRSQALGNRNNVPLESGRHLWRRWIKNSTTHDRREPGMDSALHFITPEATPRQRKPRHETTTLRLE